MGQYLKDLISQKLGSNLKEVRGMGLMIGVELSSPIAREIGKKLLDKHYLVGVIGDSIFRIVPPLIITAKDAEDFAEALGKCFE